MNCIAGRACKHQRTDVRQESKQCKVALRPREAGAVRRGPCWIEALPTELFDLIFRHVSGTAAMDAVVNHSEQHSQRHSLACMAALDGERNKAMTQVCRRWRSQLLASYYQYAVYNGQTNELEIPEEHLCYVRRILIHVPDGYRSFRMAARTMSWLPPEVRGKIRWLGLAMGEMAAISKSEYGSLAGFFPNLCRLDLDFAQVDLSERSICAALLDSDSSARITVLAFHRCGLMGQKLRARLICRAAKSLEFLDTGQFDAQLLGNVLWRGSGTPGGVCFPQLRRLYFHVCGKSEQQSESSLVPKRRQRQLFPRIEEMRCVVAALGDDEDDGGDVLGLRALVDGILGGLMPELRRLSIMFDAAWAMPELSAAAMPGLEHVLLAGKSGEAMRAALGQALGMATKSLLRHLCVRVPSIVDVGALSDFGQTSELRTLDLRTWAVSLCGMQQILGNLPRLRSLALTLTDPYSYPHPDDIGFNLQVRRLWLGAAEEGRAWDALALDSLLTLVTQMVNLQELLLFKRALLRLNNAILRDKTGDLCQFARYVNFGLCSKGEWTAVKAGFGK
ncbi:hypothetical protein IWW38_002025 [Coemansia aciculifera]|uniref:Uncharacterized protein n=1 Tax=Coemansia aciculifera TaxID=417176 RepID=A0ACC1M6C3_9FUNG|nr:hypothetical protein IWW38_002025 [Coemansia aciculifera]